MVNSPIYGQVNNSLNGILVTVPFGVVIVTLNDACAGPLHSVGLLLEMLNVWVEPCGPLTVLPVLSSPPVPCGAMFGTVAGTTAAGLAFRTLVSSTLVPTGIGLLLMSLICSWNT